MSNSKLPEAFRNRLTHCFISSEASFVRLDFINRARHSRRLSRGRDTQCCQCACKASSFRQVEEHEAEKTTLEQMCREPRFQRRNARGVSVGIAGFFFSPLFCVSVCQASTIFWLLHCADGITARRVPDTVEVAPSHIEELSIERV